MITLQQMNEKVRELAKERPDFTYSKQPGAGHDECSYVASSVGGHEGEGCIMGQALTALGIGEEVLREYEEAVGRALNILELATQYLFQDGLMKPVQLYHQIEGSREMDADMNWALKVQANQDVGMTWSEAVADADAARATLHV